MRLAHRVEPPLKSVHLVQRDPPPGAGEEGKGTDVEVVEIGQVLGELGHQAGSDRGVAVPGDQAPTDRFPLDPLHDEGGTSEEVAREGDRLGDTEPGPMDRFDQAELPTAVEPIVVNHGATDAPEDQAPAAAAKGPRFLGGPAGKAVELADLDVATEDPREPVRERLL
jgi:hypothetical protein